MLCTDSLDYQSLYNAIARQAFQEDGSFRSAMNAVHFMGAASMLLSAEKHMPVLEKVSELMQEVSLYWEGPYGAVSVVFHSVLERYTVHFFGKKVGYLVYWETSDRLEAFSAVAACYVLPGFQWRGINSHDADPS